MKPTTTQAALRSLTSMLGMVALVCASGCGPVKLTATANIPPPLVAKIPVTVALFLPKEFSDFVHKEERAGTDWHIELGKSQTDGLKRLLDAMFEHVIVVDSVNAVPAGVDVRAVLEPAVEEYAFVTPRDAGSPFFAVSVKYRMNVYTPDGKLADSWGFTGYGTAPSQGIGSDEPLTQATGLALRDAGAKLAVEFREQAIVRGLLPASSAPDTPVLPPAQSAPAPVVAPPANEAPASESKPEADEVEKKPEPVEPESLVSLSL